MARISDDELNQLKRNISIAELCKQRGIDLRPHGRKDLIGKCPFHEDENPSFVVSPDKNLFHCMGCDAAGSVVDFVMKTDGLPFKDAVDKLLSAFPGICRASELPVIETTRHAVPAERAAVLLEKVLATYERTFAEADGAKTYLEKRGITDNGLFSRHRVGYANGRLKELLPGNGNVREELKAIGVLLDNGQERFKDCVVFPVFDAEGQITTLYARYLGDGPKRHLFLPERSTGLWNAIAMKTYSEIILVESVIDALSVMMVGHQNVIAIQGTNGLNDKEIALLKTYGVQKVTLLLDGDESGGKAAARLRPRLEAVSLAVTVKALPVEHDPNSYLVKHGAEKLAEFLACTEPCRSASAAWTPGEMKSKDLNTAEIGPESSDLSTGSAALRACPEPGRRTGGDGKPTPPSVQRGHVACHAPAGSGTSSGACHASGVVVTYGMRRYEIRGLEKGPRKLRATIRVEHGGKLHVDTLDFYSAKCRRVFAMDLCRVFEEVPETIEADIEKLIRHCETMPDHQMSEVRDQKSAVESMPATERKEADEFGKSPDLFELILKDFETCGLVGEENNKLLGYLAMTSRKRDVPLSVLILSSSGAGKTALQDTVVSFCPPEDLVKLTSLSGKALFYKERLSLKNKVLALEEGDGAEEASYAIRNLISAKELVSESTIKDLATGRLVTMENKVEGPSSVFLTTTNPEIDPETKSRFFVTSVDESREQTRRILFFQRQLHQSDGLITSPEIDAILKKHRNFQRLLKPLAVKNPYAAQLTYGDDRLQGRRDQPKYLNLIKAIAFLRQLKKEIHYAQHNGQAVPFIEVDRDDIRLANKLAHEILGHSLDELSRPGRDLLDQLDEMKRKRKSDKDDEQSFFSFSRRDIREFTGWSNARVHRYLKELLDLEYVLLDSGRNGTLCRYRLLYDGQGKDGRRFMLGLAEPDQLQGPKA